MIAALNTCALDAPSATITLGFPAVKGHRQHDGGRSLPHSLGSRKEKRVMQAAIAQGSTQERQ
jgi:hypothetical protein